MPSFYNHFNRAASFSTCVTNMVNQFVLAFSRAAAISHAVFSSSKRGLYRDDMSFKLSF